MLIFKADLRPKFSPFNLMRDYFKIGKYLYLSLDLSTITQPLFSSPCHDECMAQPKDYDFIPCNFSDSKRGGFYKRN